MAGYERTYIKLKTSDLCRMLKCSPRTLKRWTVLGRIDPYSLDDLLEKMNNPHMLDHRMTPPKVVTPQE